MERRKERKEEQGEVIDVPSPVVIRAILRVAIFCIEVPEAKNYVPEAP